MIAWLTVWYLAALVLVAILWYQAYKWRLEFQQLSQQHAKTLDTVAYLKEALNACRESLARESARHGIAVEVLGLRPHEAPRVVPPGWDEPSWPETAGELLPGVSGPLRQCAPGEAAGRGGDSDLPDLAGPTVVPPERVLRDLPPRDALGRVARRSPNPDRPGREARGE